MQEYDIPNLLASHGIKIEKTTSSSYWIKCLSPSHHEKTASMSIRKSDGYFHCFGCDIGGGPLTLYRLITGEYLNVDTDYYFKQNIRKKEKEKEIPYAEIKVRGELLNPLTNSEIRSWLYKYGIEKDQFILDREIQYAEYAEIWAIPDIEVKLEPTIMNKRICSPIYHEGKLINYEGRTYVGNPLKVVYVKYGSMMTLYNWQFIDLNKDLVVVEGIKGLWRVWNVEPNVVALFHAMPSEKQIEMLNQVKGTITVFRDNDETGKKSVIALSNALDREIKVCYDPRVTKDGKGYDPNDCSSKEIEQHLLTAKFMNNDSSIETMLYGRQEDYNNEYLELRS